MGDFNLDARMEHRPDYGYKIPLNHLTDFIAVNKLFQLVNFCTWSRTINGIVKESLLDHIYTDDVALVRNLFFKDPTFGDHKLIIFELEAFIQTHQNQIIKWNWKQYTKDRLAENLVLNTVNENSDVQSQWNMFEYSFIKAIDTVAPLITVEPNLLPRYIKPPNFVKTKINNHLNM